MATRFATPVKNNDQFGNQIEISVSTVSRKLEVLEMILLDVQLTDRMPSETKFYLIDAKKMLNFARINFEKGFYNVSDASLILAKKYLERGKLVEKQRY